MTRKSFGQAIDEGDELEIQGVVYHLSPVGMKVWRDTLNSDSATEVPKRLPDESAEDYAARALPATQAKVAASIDYVVASVVEGERDALRAHIDRSVGPVLLGEIFEWLTKGLTDLDPTQQARSSAGSLPTGSSSTDGAALMESIHAV